MMKKLIGLCLMSALLCTAAWADVVDRPAHPLGSRTVVIPESPDRTGSCALGLPQAGAINAVVAPVGDISSVYLDAATDGDGGCSAPFYPFHVSSLDAVFTVWGDSSDVGQTITVTAYLSCAEDQASGTVDTPCKGPDGAWIAFATVSYTVQLSDYDTGLFNLNFPIEACLSGPVFASIRIDAWTGIPDQNPVPIFKDTPNAPQISQACKVWGYFQINWAAGIPSARCWWSAVSPLGVIADYTVSGHAIGPWYIFVNGDAGADCLPNYTCNPCPRQYGDNAANPWVVSSSPWSADLNLCDFCSDYNQETDDQIPGGGHTARGEDVVLSIGFDPLAPQACFAVVITPRCAIPAGTPNGTRFRIRSWINDSFGTLYDGNPRFPTFGQSQVYDFTASGPFGCQAADNYLLYIDTRNCCCPISVSYQGDTPLPVELTSFTATAGNGQVTLNWLTRSETGIESYEIARNGEIIATVDGLGDNATGHNYSWVDNNVVNGTHYSYRLTAYGTDGSVMNFTNTAEATPFGAIATEYALAQNFPNPFNPSTSITYSVKEAGNVTLKVFSIDGREVATLVDGHQDANVYSVNFDAANLASGVYMYTLEVNGFTATKKMVLMK